MAEMDFNKEVKKKKERIWSNKNILMNVVVHSPLWTVIRTSRITPISPNVALHRTNEQPYKTETRIESNRMRRGRCAEGEEATESARDNF